MDTETLLQLWHYGDRACTMTPANEPSPYWVVIAEGEQTLSRRSFADHHGRPSSPLTNCAARANLNFLIARTAGGGRRAARRDPPKTGGIVPAHRRNMIGAGV